jgi:hypothetical protein
MESREAYCWFGGLMNTNVSVNFEAGGLTKGPKMSVLTLCRDGSTAIGESITSTIADGIGDKMRPQITPSMLQYIAWLPQARRNKILEVRKQLARGTYDLDERLDAVLDRLLADIKTQANTPAESTVNNHK